MCFTKTDRGRNKQWTIFFAVVSFAVILFVFGNSLQKAEQSNELSKTVAVTLNPKLDSCVQEEKDLFNSHLRKAAHLVEFLVLGICVSGFTVNLGRLLGRRYVSLPLLIVLTVAVGDEFIQHFTGRGSTVTDVMLDFLGALVGLALVALFCGLRSKLVRRK